MLYNAYKAALPEWLRDRTAAYTFWSLLLLLLMLPLGAVALAVAVTPSSPDCRCYQQASEIAVGTLAWPCCTQTRQRHDGASGQQQNYQVAESEAGYAI